MFVSPLLHSCRHPSLLHLSCSRAAMGGGGGGGFTIFVWWIHYDDSEKVIHTLVVWSNPHIFCFSCQTVAMVIVLNCMLPSMGRDFFLFPFRPPRTEECGSRHGRPVVWLFRECTHTNASMISIECWYAFLSLTRACVCSPYLPATSTVLFPQSVIPVV